MLPTPPRPVPQPPPLPISPLPLATTSLLRSTLVIPSLPSLLVELVQNSLDARATQINLGVDLDRWTIKCEDNGSGIAWSDLSKVGGERYWTSKTRGEDEETFGFRGEALASMADVGVLEIWTRPSGMSARDEQDEMQMDEGESFELVVKGGRQLSQGKATSKRPSSGTTVWVRDIFYKWPVRRRPLSTPSARNTLLSSFKQALSTMSLLHPAVAFSLTDTSESSSAAKRLVSVPRSSEGVLGRWRQLWGRAGVEKVFQYDVTEEEGSGSSELRAQGFFSATASHSKTSQFIFVNSRPLAVSPLHKLINHRFSQSSFSRHAASHLVAPLSPTPSSQKSQEGTKASRKSPKKVSERFPVFVLNLVAPPAMVDVTLEPEKRVVEFEDSDRVHTFVQNIVDDFLRDQGFMSASRSLASREGSYEELSNSEAESPAVKRRKKDSTASMGEEPPLAATPERVVVQAQDLHVFPQMTPTPGPSNDPSPPTRTPSPIRWTDPSTRQTFLIDPRTGHSWNAGVLRQHSMNGCADCEDDTEGEDERPPSAGGRRRLVDRSSLKRKISWSDEDRGAEEVGQGQVPAWMIETLENWQNPTFTLSSPLIPSLPAVNSDFPLAPAPRAAPHPSFDSSTHLSRSRIATLDAFFRTSSHTPSSTPLSDHSSDLRFTETDLSHAVFIAQVDRKFLLVKLRSSSSATARETLVLVDQHAADERCRVEVLLEEFVGKVAKGEEVEQWEFEEARGVVLAKEEAKSLKEWRDEFGRWGIEVGEGETGAEEVEGGEGGDYVQVWVKTVPRVVKERLWNDPRLLQELLRSFLAQLEADGGGATKRRPTSATWGSLGQCPAVLLDLINSKACRGAIMFNDELTAKQCTTLLSRLAQCSFPFQCAHGRPSMIPVVNLVEEKGEPSNAAGAVDWSLLAEGEGRQ